MSTSPDGGRRGLTVTRPSPTVAGVSASIGLLIVTFFSAPFLSRFIGETANSVMSRLMGMILAAIAMEMMTDSLKVLLPGLA